MYVLTILPQHVEVYAFEYNTITAPRAVIPMRSVIQNA